MTRLVLLHCHRFGRSSWTTANVSDQLVFLWRWKKQSRREKGRLAIWQYLVAKIVTKTESKSRGRAEEEVNTPIPCEDKQIFLVFIRGDGKRKREIMRREHSETLPICRCHFRCTYRRTRVLAVHFNERQNYIIFSSPFLASHRWPLYSGYYCQVKKKPFLSKEWQQQMHERKKTTHIKLLYYSHTT